MEIKRAAGRCARLRLRPAINVARLPIVVEFHYHDRKAGIISKSLATRRAANEVVGNGAIFMRGRGRYQKRETIIIDGGLSRWAKYVARKTDGDLSGWKDRRRGAARRALPADVFVVLLKPRVNYARGINERPRQSDRIEIRPQLGTIGIMIERTRSRFNVKYTRGNPITAVWSPCTS
jgi:hypothetical protein